MVWHGYSETAWLLSLCDDIRAKGARSIYVQYVHAYPFMTFFASAINRLSATRSRAYSLFSALSPTALPIARPEKGYVMIRRGIRDTRNQWRRVAREGAT